MLQKRIAKEIESVFEKLQKGNSAYSKGEFYQDHFFYTVKSCTCGLK
jgi:hypothetical protein